MPSFSLQLDLQDSPVEHKQIAMVTLGFVTIPFAPEALILIRLYFQLTTDAIHHSYIYTSTLILKLNASFYFLPITVQQEYKYWQTLILSHEVRSFYS